MEIERETFAIVSNLLRLSRIIPDPLETNSDFFHVGSGLAGRACGIRAGEIMLPRLIAEPFQKSRMVTDDQTPASHSFKKSPLNPIFPIAIVESGLSG